MDKSEVSRPIIITLDGPNYIPWSQAMSSFLKGRKLWRYITGDVKAPTHGAAETPTEFIRQEPGQSISAFLPQIYSIWDQLTPSEPKWLCAGDSTLFATYRDQQRLILFLMGLSDIYEPVRASLLHRIPLPTLEQAISELLSEETRLGLVSTSHVATAFATSGSRGRGSSGGSRSFSASGSQSSGGSASRPNECTFCHATDHRLLTCPIRVCKTCRQRGPDHYRSDCPNNPTRRDTRPQSTAATAGVSSTTSASPTLIDVSDLPALVQQILSASGNPSTALSASTGVLGPTINEHLDCQSCQLAKQPALSFTKSTSVSSAPFALVHSDIWGPSPTSTMGGSQYFVIFVDDFLRYTWLYLLKNRSQLQQTYYDFARMIKTQFSRDIKVFRSDNAQEYCDTSFFAFLREQGTLPHRSCPGTSQQNGRAERKHRHLLDTTRALLISSGYPERFWGEAALIAAYTINRVPSPLLGNLTLYERLYGTPPDYHSLRVFGCACFVLLQPHERTKLEPRSRLCCFLGYGIEHKGYRCWDPLSLVVFEYLVTLSFGNIRCFPLCPLFRCPLLPLLPTLLILPLTFSLKMLMFLLTFLMILSMWHHRPLSIPWSLSSTDPAPPVLPPVPLPSDIHVRRSTRVREVPSYLRDYHCFSTVLAQYEPRSYREASTNPLWQQAMTEELQALDRTHTWDLVDLPPGKSIIGCRWFMSAPRSTHYAAVLRILRYVKGTLFHGLHFSSQSSLQLYAYSDTDWAGDPTDRRSTTGFCFFLGDSLISWRSKKQTLVARSSTEAEYRALADTTQELLWLRWLLQDMGVSHSGATVLHCDNRSAILIAHNDVFHDRTKHIEIDCHFIR
ncbi:hypothetical protein Acr_00g0069360 [Actinidia rufa]|uniref:Integrase catalytic domain-containing protein n=1 Tax=Actinidia rufa TaxID=165716 RepID=A0A7J0DR57_9ERIC|nr:hypothetical protein Acr_00g0069360 [Actinidia rufa]